MAASRTSRTSRSTQAKAEVETPVVEAEVTEVPEAEAQVGSETEAEAPAESDEANLTNDQIMELVRKLQAENEALKARPVRKAREVKPTPKQFKFLRALIENPTLSVPELCTEAGATETSHGFVFRMLEHNFLAISIPEDVIRTYGLVSEDDAEVGESTDDEGNEVNEEQASATA